MRSVLLVAVLVVAGCADPVDDAPVGALRLGAVLGRPRWFIRLSVCRWILPAPWVLSRVWRHQKAAASQRRRRPP